MKISEANRLAKGCAAGLIKAMDLDQFYGERRLDNLTESDRILLEQAKFALVKKLKGKS